VMRLFEQSIAQKVSNAFLVDVAFSASTLAAPIVAAMSLGAARVTSSSLIAGIPHVSVELGVAAIQPVLTARSARAPDGERGEKRLAHWRQIVIAACEQCGRNRIPEVRAVMTLERWLESRDPAAAGLVMAPTADVSIAASPRPRNALDLLVGPEGGFAPDEIALAQESGMTAVRLGPRVLRAETAALASLAAVNALWGDFR